jgi:hypothetical protein
MAITTEGVLHSQVQPKAFNTQTFKAFIQELIPKILYPSTPSRGCADSGAHEDAPRAPGNRERRIQDGGCGT